MHDDVDFTDIDQLLCAMTTRANPSDDIDILRSTFTSRNDQSLAPDKQLYGSKALINACTPHKYIGKNPAWSPWSTVIDAKSTQALPKGIFVL